MFLKSHLLLFIFQMFVEVSLSLKFFLSYLFVLNIYVYICVMCMYIYVCVCIYTHLHTHFIYHHLNGILIYQHTSAAPVYNLGFLKKFLKLFLMKNSKLKSKETINNNINLGLLHCRWILYYLRHKGLNTVTCYCWNILNAKRSVISFMNT